MSARMFAAVGKRGRRALVFGLGRTAEQAIDDGWGQCDSEAQARRLVAVAITAEQAAIVRRGDCSWPVVTEVAS